MIRTAVVALFCEDIREEKSGVVTLVGVMGDNVALPPPTTESPGQFGMLAKLGIYVRINFDPSAELGDVTINTTLPNGQQMDPYRVDKALIAQAITTRNQNSPIAAIIVRLQLGPIIVPREMGSVKIEATIAGETYVAGALTFVILPPASPS